MKYLIFSDTHGDLEELDRAIFYYKPDVIFGLGDYGFNEYELIDRNISGVKGNSPFDPDYDIDRTCVIKGVETLFTHGHTHYVHSELLYLYYFCKENNIKLAFYGHTHNAKITKEDDIYFINPGSLGRPYTPSFPTCVFMDIDDEEINIRIVDTLEFKTYQEVKIDKAIWKK